MIISLSVGIVLEVPADVLIVPANPWLSMSSGINADILARCGMQIQEELNEYLSECGLKSVSAATVVPTTAPGLPFRHLVHAVAVDGFEQTNRTMVTKTLTAAFKLSDAFTASSVTLPPIATGYGPLSIGEFGLALAAAADTQKYFCETIKLVLQDDEDKEELQSALEDYSFINEIDFRP